MSIEMVDSSTKPENGEASDNMIEHSTQEVGTTGSLPRLYSASGRYEDSFVGNFDTYGSYSANGMYGNHASLNYLFGNLGSTMKNTNTKTRRAEIRYDGKGTILNYTSLVAEMFLLKDKEGFMGDNILNLVDPSFVKEKGEKTVQEAFGLFQEGASGSPEVEKDHESKLVGVKTNGESFELSVTLVKVSSNVITARLSDGSDNTVQVSRMQSSSSFSSYADTLSQSHAYSVGSVGQNSFYGHDYTSSVNQFGGLVVDMAEIGTDNEEWIGTGRYCAGQEEVFEEGNGRLGGISAVSLTAFSDLRRGLENGVILLDTEADSLPEVVNALLDDSELKQISTPDIRNPLVQLFSMKDSSLPIIQEGEQREGCKVYVAKLSFLSKPIIAMVRVKTPIVVQEQSPLLIRYFLFVLGSKTCTSTSQLHEMGRAFSLMMSQNWFSNAARKINTDRLFLKLMDNFMTRCTMLPPPDPYAANPFQRRSVMGQTHGCCGKKDQQTITVFMPNTTFQRTNHQLRRRQRVINEHDNLLKTEALQKEPTMEELEKDKPSMFISHLTTRDWVVGGLTIVCCVAVLVLLLAHHFVPYEDGKHVVPMLGYSMSIFGGLKAITSSEPAYYSLPDSPRGLYEVRAAIQASTVPYSMEFQLYERIGEEEIPHGSLTSILSAAETETESLQELDVSSDIRPVGESSLFLKVTTNSSAPISFVLYADSMNPIGRYRIVLGSIILVGVYVLLLLEVINRAVVAFIGAFLTLLLISFVHDAPSLSTVINWMDESTLCLLFGMMIMIQMLSTTGMFEYLAVQMLTITKGHILALNISLCLLTAVCSAFLDNVTTMLLIAPVTIELSRMMDVNPIPFLLPEVIYSNIGGTATQIGDPPNLIIGNMLKEHIGFVDFIKNATPCVLICLVVVYPFVVFYYRKDLLKPKVHVDESLKERYQIKNKPLLLKCGSILITVILLFFLHSFHHIDTAYLAIAGAFACLFLGTNEDLHTTFELLEWETLVFFAGLFIMIEGVNELGVIRAIGNGVSSLIMSSPPRYQSLLAHMLILWVSGLASSVLDNIAFTATMIPVIRILGEHPELSERMNIYTLAWALAFGACFGGNGTLVGAGANLVTAGICATNGHPVSFGQFFKFGFTCMMITMIVSTIYVWCRYVYHCLFDYQTCNHHYCLSYYNKQSTTVHNMKVVD